MHRTALRTRKIGLGLGKGPALRFAVPFEILQFLFSKAEK
jgi:hypothetical protein